jgi:hypothetical protein
MIPMLVARLDGALAGTSVIPWSSPVPSFGDLANSSLATLGLNPSNREFVDELGEELVGGARRFHTLNSLGISRWSHASTQHMQLIGDSCRSYFLRNPYDGWFKRLDGLLAGTKLSYYGNVARACHLDLIPYATACKWTGLSHQERATLMVAAGETLGYLVRESPVRVLVLNGNSVVRGFEDIAGVKLQKCEMPEWALPRRLQPHVMGFAYKGTVRRLATVELQREVLVLGYNHNIQSSFGVTTKVTAAIGRWISSVAMEVLA